MGGCACVCIIGGKGCFDDVSSRTFLAGSRPRMIVSTSHKSAERDGDHHPAQSNTGPGAEDQTSYIPMV